MKATFIKDLHGGAQRLYSVEPRAAYGRDSAASHVITSKVNNEWSHETYIFPADETGSIVDWCELDGSAQGEHCHESVLRAAGYEVISASAK